MKLAKIARHYGVSFNKGDLLTHLWIKNTTTRELFSRWDRFFIAPGLAKKLIKSHGYLEGSTHYYSEVYPFLSLDLIKEILERKELHASDSLAYEKMLTNIGFEASIYSQTYKKYFDIAQKKGWIAIPDIFGSVFVTLFGAGKFAQLMMMNNHESTAGILTYAGIDKMFCKGFFAAFGINSPKAALTATSEGAAVIASNIGYPVVIKTPYGANNAGVIAGINNKKECLSAAKKLLAISRSVIVEKMITGKEYRLHFVNGRLTSVFMADPLFVVGDGKTCLAKLIKNKYQNYYRTIMSYKFHQDILICILWRHGIKRFPEVAAFIPRRSQKIIISSSTGRTVMKEVPMTAINKADIRTLERIFERYGSPSAGIDMILKSAGTRINDGGGILEMNLPCGIIYLKNMEKVIKNELINKLNRMAGFIKAKGKVPVWIAVKGQTGTLKSKFKKKYPNGHIAELNADTNWLQILYSADAEAFLVFVDKESILQHGMPINLNPILFFPGSRKKLSRDHPVVTKTIKNAGGKIVRLQPQNHPDRIQT